MSRATLRHNDPVSRLAWMLVLISASLALSSLLACATPFAALAAVGALTLKRSDALAVAIIAWLINQAIGFVLLGYPTDTTTIAWGAAMGLSSVVAVFGAFGAARVVRDLPNTVAASIVLTCALVAQQLIIVAASLFLESHSSAFAPYVLAWIAVTNALCFLVLMSINELGERVGHNNKSTTTG